MDEVTNVVDQAALWRGSFGDEYNARNARDPRADIAFFARALARTHDVRSVVELGAGTGTNLVALGFLFPNLLVTGIEINDKAFDILRRVAPNSLHGSVLDIAPMQAELVLTKGLLIHLHPDARLVAYSRMMKTTTRYVLMAEYYSPRSEMVPYRGNANAMWKADFAGEMMTQYPSLRLLDYGFIYHADPNFPQDDLNWFLLSK